MSCVASRLLRHLFPTNKVLGSVESFMFLLESGSIFFVNFGIPDPRISFNPRAFPSTVKTSPHLGDSSYFYNIDNAAWLAYRHETKSDLGLDWVGHDSLLVG
jgi:hypothetical protein